MTGSDGKRAADMGDSGDAPVVARQNPPVTEPPKQSETAAERAARWAAESAQVKPRSRVAELLDAYLLKVLGGLVLVALFGGIAVGVLAIAHRDQPGAHQTAGGITAAAASSTTRAATSRARSRARPCPRSTVPRSTWPRPS